MGRHFTHPEYLANFRQVLPLGTHVPSAIDAHARLPVCSDPAYGPIGLGLCQPFVSRRAGNSAISASPSMVCAPGFLMPLALRNSLITRSKPTCNRFRN